MNFRNLARLRKSAHALTSPCYAKTILIAVQATTKFFTTQCEAISCTSISQFARLLKLLKIFQSILITNKQLAYVFVAFSLFSSSVYSKEANRIIALSPHSVEMLYAIGAGDKIVATIEYADYPKAALDIVRIGNHNGIQIEQVLKLKPDLIVAWKGGNKGTDLDKIESLGFKIVYTQPKKIAEISPDLRMLGQLTGRQKQAEAVIAQFDKRYNNIREHYQKLAKVDVFYQLWHDPLQSIGPLSWIESLISDCGGRNIFHNANVAYPMVSIESVLVKNPKVIIIPHHSGSDELKGNSERKKIWLKWPEISAVKNHLIFDLNGDLLHRTTTRSLDGLEKLCERIDEAR